MFDKRGTGLSDRVPLDQLPTLEERMDDLRAVLDAVGSDRAALFGFSEGGALCTLFAATYPERTQALVVYGGYARWVRSDDYPWAPTREQHETALRHLEDHWGQPQEPGPFAPSLAGDTAAMERSARYDRMASSPGAAVALVRMNIDADTRAVLPAIQAPTLILHRTGDRLIRVECGRYLADHIPGAKLVELAGVDHLPWVGDSDTIVDEIQEFLTGLRPGVAPERTLATVLFTDIVASTARQAEAGDRRWKALLDDLDTVTARQVQRARGRLVKSTGDGTLAVFDGPARAIRCALDIIDAANTLGVQLRAGLHTGEIELRADHNDVAGFAVHLAQRVCSAADDGQVFVSRTVVDLVAGSGLVFADQGEHHLKGVPTSWQLFRAER